MRNIIIKALLSIIIFIFSFSIARSQYALMYKNTVHNYSINLPKSMEVTELPSHEVPDSLIAVAKDGSVFSIITKKDPAYKGVTASMLTSNSFMPELKFRYKNIELKENDFIDIAGEPTLYMRVDYKNQEEEGVVVQYILIKSEKVFILRLVSSKENFDKFASELAGYIFTFQFMESSAKEFYKSDMYSFFIKFPYDWQFDRNEFPVQAYNSRGSSMYIEVIKNTEYKNLTINDVDSDLFLEAEKAKLSNISLAGKKKLNIDGTPALFMKYKWIQTTPGKTETYYILHYYMLKGSLLYVIQGMIKEAYLHEDEKLVDQSVDTFQFTK
ncbi:MAG: hypothetical protein MUE56_10030 [Ignavibacteria bacterium]|nr:hypothetical protein [Ignavibacteria bacterium]